MWLRVLQRFDIITRQQATQAIITIFKVGGIPLANTKSAQKRIRSDERKRLRNQKVRSRVKTFVKKAEQSIGTDVELTVEAIRQACSELDRAASKGVLHKNNAARRKSRLMAKFNKANASA
jgi:small subunit ribosomal protein S20